MSINVNVGNNIPAEVIEVGQEISVNQLAAITAATSPSAINPFTTLGHTHVAANITDLEGILALKSNTSHTHVIADVTGLQTALDAKAIAGHIHNIWDVADLQINLDDKAPLVHTHAIADTTGLQTALDGKALVAHTHAIADTTGLQTALDGKSATTHLHTGVYAPVTHSHAIADVTGLQTALDSKTSGAGYALLTGATFSGEIATPQIGNLLNTDLIIDAYNDTGSGTHYYHKFNPSGGFELAPNGGYILAGNYIVNSNGFSTSWIQEGEIGRNFILSNTGLTWDNSTTLSYVLGTGFSFNNRLSITTPTTQYPTLNIGAFTTTPTTTIAGDIWIGTNINFKAFDGVSKSVANTNTTNVYSSPQIIDTNSTTQALRVTQKGTGNALVVEDTTTPDTSSFLVNNDGKVYVNYNPANATDTVADFRVTKKAGSSFAAYFDSQSINDGGSTVQISSHANGSPLICSGGLTRLYGGIQVGTTGAQILQIDQAVSGTGTYTHEIQISMNGNNLRIPCRVV